MGRSPPVAQSAESPLSGKRVIPEVDSQQHKRYSTTQPNPLEALRRCDQSISCYARRHRPHGVTGNPDHEEDATEDEHLNRRGHTVWVNKEGQVAIKNTRVLALVIPTTELSNRVFLVLVTV